MPSRTDTTQATVVVTAVDKGARSFSVKMSDGSKTEIQAPADMKEFDKIKVGDKIDVTYTESLVLGMLPKGTKPSVTSSAATNPGAAGAAVTVSAEESSASTRPTTRSPSRGRRGSCGPWPWSIRICRRGCRA